MEATFVPDPDDPGGIRPNQPELNHQFLHALLSERYPLHYYARSEGGAVATNDGFTHAILCEYFGPDEPVPDEEEPVPA